MMRKLIFCLFVLLWSGLAAASLNEGMAAYNSGDMKAAAAEFQKLPKKSGFVLYTLGVMFESGQGVAKDGKLAVKWFSLASKQAGADKLWATLSEHNLGVIYAKGEGVPQDFKVALGWFRKAAERGHAPSQYNLAVMYIEGEGTSVDYIQAKRWLDRAAASGDKKSMKLGERLEKGMATKQITVPLGSVEIKSNK